MPRVFYGGNRLTPLLVIAGLLVGLQARAVAQPSPFAYNGGPDSQVLTRGPIHEAFAEAISLNPQPGFVVDRPPPPPIDEQPPSQRPNGANIAWIPGYWAWDDDRKDFIWISGAWRDVPFGQQWVAGYWASADNGFQWVAGYWASAKTQNISYLPQPPQSLETGPVGAMPSPNNYWVPGNYNYVGGNYDWSPGYWSAGTPGWMWIPPHYVWTPRGYVYVGGYWDYPLNKRGALYAPMNFQNQAYARPGFSYTPSVLMNLGLLTSNLFMRPNYNHYYFGDYYDPRYSQMGIQPWYSYHNNRFGYDPIYSYSRWQNLPHNPDWERQQHEHFHERQVNPALRPPQTYAELKERHERIPEGVPRSLPIASSTQHYANHPASPNQFHEIEAAEHQALVQRNQEFNKFREERLQLEKTRPAVPVKTNIPTQTIGRTEPFNLQFPKSPVTSRPVDELKQHEAWRNHFNENNTRVGTPSPHSVTPNFNFQPPPRHEHPPEHHALPQNQNPQNQVRQRPETKPEPKPEVKKGR